MRLKETDPEDVPIFVARESHKLPPVIFDHMDVTRLLKDLVKIKDEIKLIRDVYATVQNLNEVKFDIELFKRASIVNHSNLDRNVNKRRGATVLRSFEYDIGPMGLEHDNVAIKTRSSSPPKCISPKPRQDIFKNESLTKNYSTVGVYKRAETGFVDALPLATEHLTAGAVTHVAPEDDALHIARPVYEQQQLTVHEKIKSFSDVTKESEWKRQSRSENEILIHRNV